MAASRFNRSSSLWCEIDAVVLHRAHKLCRKCLYRQRIGLGARHFRTSPARSEQQHHRKESYASRLRSALASSPIRWRPIPVGLGIGFLGVWQFYRIQQRQQERQWEQDRGFHTSPELEGDEENGKKPRKRDRIKPSGPWQVQVMSTLPLKAISRLWGRFNELTIPYYLRVPGFKLYSKIFGVNLSEVAEPDLHTYPNLASFFYREIKPDVRPLDPNTSALLSPADGRVVQYGTIDREGDIEQVKGVTYKLDALLGAARPSSPSPDKPAQTANASVSSRSPKPLADRKATGSEDHVTSDEEFATVNGISYTLPNIFSGPGSDRGRKQVTDQSTTSKPGSESEVRADLALGEQPWWAPFRSSPTAPTTLYYMVVYLAPGDYHRFHSPVSWVVSQRRHFAGELYSVSPYLVRTLPGLFTLNERVVLLGRWRYGFFSYIPIGATNVGSIVVNFDRELRTNSLTTDTAADRAAEAAKERGEPYGGFAEATYADSSKVLAGHALKRGEEMGGFQLGSTIVMVFEAPKGLRPSLDQGFNGERRGGWRWLVDKGQKVKVGQALGEVIEDE